MRGALLRGWCCRAPRASPFRPPGPRIPAALTARSPSTTSTTPSPRSTPAAADVASVQGKLAAAQQRLETTQIAAAKAAEAFNGARYEAQQATQASRLADEQAVAAAADLERQRAAYADAAVAAYQFSPQLTALGAISQADGITEVLESTAALQNA